MVFGLFGKRDASRKKKRKLNRRLPTRQLAPVKEIAEQGSLVADVAVRMTVKNDIIMNALKANVDYDEAHIVELVRQAIIDLAEERERDAKYIGQMLGEIKSTGSSAFSESEYHNEDNRTLRHRREVYELVAEELRQRSEDEEYLRGTAEKARELAWGEIGDSLKDRAMHPYYSGGGSAEYRKHREDRIATFIEKDLTELVMDASNKRQKGRKKKAE